MFFERLVLATGNQGKYREFAALLPRSLVGELVFAPELSKLSVDETGATYTENALLKARAWASASGLPSLADDSGLEVAALDGAPGVHSARAVPGDDGARNAWLLSELGNREDRSARFVAALALVIPGGKEFICEGECPGRIAGAPSGAGGFGYDPLFLPDGFDASFADIPPETKNAISHRAAAVRALLKIFEQDSE
ncbi:MAG: RdgB/HAM1 family non-canonical purine NTP pyrophosphatase [Fretibacterium sp.]|nr:RdgB/HAM1 family non-canonical purine NTP pyrophosphatase [Fretibacterium sp.]